MQWIKQDINIGVNFRKIRNRLNLTQAEIVAKLQLLGSSMSRVTYTNIEIGRRNIKVSDLILLKMAFEVDYSELFEGLMEGE